MRSVTLRDLPALSPEPAIPDTASPGERASAPQAQGDTAAFALLYGRYLGQITARIERAWMRPRNSPGTDTFACRLQVLQDERGQVLGVTIGHCNGDARWQASLVEAVRSASPLPAPPDPHVFRRSVALALTSAAFVPGGSTQGFEPEALTAMRAPAGSSPASAAPDYLDQLRALREGRPGNVDLRIEGSQHANEAIPGPPGPWEESAPAEVPATPR
ncbi:MAG: TonB C-terminal domain-containing protein [Steroidobacteraceae bacterium]